MKNKIELFSDSELKKNGKQSNINESKHDELFWPEFLEIHHHNIQYSNISQMNQNFFQISNNIF